jgi:hypothetical protein
MQNLWLATGRQGRIATFRQWLARRGDRLADVAAALVKPAGS